MTTKFFNKGSLTKEQKDYVKHMKSVPFKDYPQNEIYKTVKNYLIEIMEGKHPGLFPVEFLTYCELNSQPIVTSVPNFSYNSECTTFYTPDGSHIRVKSRAKSLDITRVWILPENHGVGLGTTLMKMVLFGVVHHRFTTGDFPKVVLECTGAVGWGENRQDTPLEDQIRFFKKFGFVLDRVDDYGTHHMILNEEEFHDYMMGLLKK
jgi:hypothetical protein